MTTVVLHEGVISVDSLITCASRKYIGDKFIRSEEALYLFCGGCSNARAVIADLATKPDAVPDEDTTVFQVHEGVLRVLTSEGWYDPETTQTWGSGGDAALAAVYCGKDSRDACEIGTQVDLYSGGAVRSFRVETGEEL